MPVPNIEWAMSPRCAPRRLGDPQDGGGYVGGPAYGMRSDVRIAVELGSLKDLPIGTQTLFCSGVCFSDSGHCSRSRPPLKSIWGGGIGRRPFAEGGGALGATLKAQAPLHVISLRVAPVPRARSSLIYRRRFGGPLPPQLVGWEPALSLCAPPNVGGSDGTRRQQRPPPPRHTHTRVSLVLTPSFVSAGPRIFF